MPARQLAAGPEWEQLAQVLREMPPQELERFLAQHPRYRPAMERALAELTGVGWRATPATMAEHLDPEHFTRYPYVDLLAEKFTDLVEGRSRFQIWNVPARTGKTTLCDWGCAWVFDRYPEARIIRTAYADDLATSSALFVRDVLQQHGDVLRTRLRQDRKRSDWWHTEHGGRLLARGMRSGITGFGAGRHGGIIIDDPFKNWEEAHSPTMRKRVIAAWQTVLRLRLDDPTAWVLVVHTRWHPEDLTGYLTSAAEEAGTWEHVRLPALAELHDPDSIDKLLRVPDPLGRQPGQVIEPRRFDEAEVRERARTLGPYLAAALEQQRPSPDEGGEIRRAWFVFTEPDAWPAAMDVWATSWDMKMTGRKSGSYVVGQVWGRKGSSFYLHDQVRGQWGLATVQVAIALVAVRHPQAGAHYVENTGNGPEVMKALRDGDPTRRISDEDLVELGIDGDQDTEGTEAWRVRQLLRTGMPGLLPVVVKGDKVVRVRSVQGILAGLHVHLPTGTSWAAGLVNEAAEFPNGANDDQVDALSQALAKLRPIAEGVQVAEGTVARPAPGANVSRAQRLGGSSGGRPQGLPPGFPRPGRRPR